MIIFYLMLVSEISTAQRIVLCPQKNWPYWFK